jgi:hypothetical protein
MTVDIPNFSEAACTGTSCITELVDPTNVTEIEYALNTLTLSDGEQYMLELAPDTLKQAYKGSFRDGRTYRTQPRSGACSARERAARAIAGEPRYQDQAYESLLAKQAPSRLDSEALAFVLGGRGEILKAERRRTSPEILQP